MSESLARVFEKRGGGVFVEEDVRREEESREEDCIGSVRVEWLLLWLHHCGCNFVDEWALRVLIIAAVVVWVSIYG